MPFPSVNTFGVPNTPLTNSPFAEADADGNGGGRPPVITNDFLLLDGTFFKLLDGTNFKLLTP